MKQEQSKEVRSSHPTTNSVDFSHKHNAAVQETELLAPGASQFYRQSRLSSQIFHAGLRLLLLKK
jgi:hypothetical protein